MILKGSCDPNPQERKSLLNNHALNTQIFGNPKCRKSLENVSRGPGTPKSLQKARRQSGKSPESPQKVWRVFLESSRTFGRPFRGPGRRPQDCDPRVPLQRSKLGNQGNDILGSKNAFFGGPSWNYLNGLFGAFNCLPKQKCHFPDFPFVTSVGGPWDRNPRNHFRDFFGIPGPEGPRDLCKGQAGSQTNFAKINILK